MKVTLRKMKIAGGKQSLFLDITDKGRHKQYLKLFIYTKPKDFLQKKHNEETLRQAEAIRANTQLDLQADKHGLESKHKQGMNFVTYYKAWKDKYTKKDTNKVNGCLKYLELFLIENKITTLTGAKVTKLLCEDFTEYLKTKLGQETARSYMQKFKQVLDRAFDEKITTINSASFKTRFKIDKDAIKKPLLEPEEIEKLLTAECPGSPTIRRAYLLSLNTGFDFSTVNKLYGWMVDKNRLVFDRSKTESQNSFPLNDNALKLIGKIEDPEAKLFNLPSYNTCIKHIREWATNAGISKKITWHSARHSFATNLSSEYNADVTVIQQLLGHQDIRTTMKYVKVKDKKKRDAVNRMPDMEV